MEKIEKFEDMKIGEKTLSYLKKSGFVEPTDVQKEAIIPAIEGRDMIVQARTGSGKTLSFLIPVFEGIEGKNGVEAIILVPVRELAQQVEEEARKIGKFHGIDTVAVYGGASIENQIKKLKSASVVVGTPGRVIDLMKRGALNMDNLKFFVLDEADRMLDMGFYEDMEWIISRTPENKQVMLYSATMPDEIIKLAKKHMKDPLKLKLSEDSISATGVEQYHIRVGSMNKMAKLSALLDNEKGKYLIFTRTKIAARKVAELLRKHGYRVFAIHGDMSQSARTKTMNDFKSGKIDILVATDVASRGIDVQGITHVINYDIPLYPKDYVHRIGRTGRLDKKGKAITFVTKDEMGALRRIEEYIGRKIPEMRLKVRGRIRERMDYREHADVFGMVTFVFTADEGMSTLDVVKELEKQGIREEDIGKIEIDGKKGEFEVHYSSAHRATKSGLKEIRLKAKESKP